MVYETITWKCIFQECHYDYQVTFQDHVLFISVNRFIKSGIIPELMTLLETLERNRLSLKDIDWARSGIYGSFNEADLKGRIAQHFVGEWLDACDGIQQDSDFPRQSGRYHLKKNYMGIIVCDENEKSLHEFDFMFYHDGNPCVAEVKSYKLHGFAKNIPSSLKFADEIYSHGSFGSSGDVPLLLFFPIFESRSDYACSLQREYPQLHCIDTGYRISELESLMERFRMSRDGYVYNDSRRTIIKTGRRTP